MMVGRRCPAAALYLVCIRLDYAVCSVLRDTHVTTAKKEDDHILNPPGSIYMLCYS